MGLFLISGTFFSSSFLPVPAFPALSVSWVGKQKSQSGHGVPYCYPGFRGSCRLGWGAYLLFSCASLWKYFFFVYIYWLLVDTAYGMDGDTGGFNSMKTGCCAWPDLARYMMSSSVCFWSDV
ncbi:hypothetical protein IMZ48_41770 [Candidatus Bathyarchaeota archaeon]|nr:hypothetical protein [Candidatus Bathyarchaeota archaeon]